ncbi:DASH complex subunit dam1 [Ascochyta rabiei]|uniref:DASH complex subunit DAM1 n=1 Tax=Didymella rabiei TaxID=5454 RepID=A0A163GUR5_DIDRA|nr:DASH complex subunit dam1 [Ascochyta rabiei]KZM25024.1 attachment of spindle microtubules to kinetochore [Ascochyta rabiei]UPX19173.1 DASH complex subunit dam1 [Ascochyta rabiei]
MASTTPTREPPSSRDRRLRSRSPRSRPTTPLRPASRSSLRDSAQRSRGAPSSHALDRLQDGFAELSDAMADLEQNFVQLQLMHESLARFTESFAGFLYGMNMNAFCVDFPEAPVLDSFRRPQNHTSLNPSAHLPNRRASAVDDADATFLTTDTSFVDNPPSSKVATKFKNAASPAPTPKKTAPGRARGIPTARGRGGISTRGGAARGARGSGIARGSARARGRGV